MNRKKLIAWLFEQSQCLYVKHFKKSKTPWGLTAKMLLSYPTTCFGYKLGVFLIQNRFELLPKVERHDAYHVLTGFGTVVEDEIALQYMCFGNGKRSPYLIGVLLLGTLILPEYLPFYRKAFLLGKASFSFHHFDYKQLLEINYNELREAVFTHEVRNSLQHLHSIKDNRKFYFKTT